MSDDFLTSIAKLNSISEAKVSSETLAERNAQDADFKRAVEQESKKLLATFGPKRGDESQKNQSMENQSMEGKNTSVDVSEQAINGQQSYDSLGLSGNSLPNLSLHNGALAVGRVIYTTGSSAVTSESLSKFMARQGLLNDHVASGQDDAGAGLARAGGDLAESTIETVAPEISVFENEPFGHSTVSLGDSSKGGGSKANSEAGASSFNASNAATQLAVKQAINARVSQSEVNTGLLATEPGKQELESEVLIGRTQDADTRIGPASANKEFWSNSGPSPQLAAGGISREGLVPQSEVNTELPRPEPGKEFSSTKEKSAEIVEGRQRRLTGDQSNFSKLDGKVELESVRLQIPLNKLHESIGDGSQFGLKSSPGNLETSLKAYPDLGHVNDSEGFNNELSHNRLEFKGALRDAQRMVASNTYNNLTDSYENWSVKFGEILAQRISGHVNKGNWNIQIRLNPASLGEISLELELSEKGLEGRFGSNEESTRQLLQDTLPKLRLALRELLDEHQELSFDVTDFGNANLGNGDQSEKSASSEIVEELNFESEVLNGTTLDARLTSLVGLDILV